MRQVNSIVKHRVQTLAFTAAAILAAACSDKTNAPTAPEAAQSSGQVHDANWFATTAKPKFASEGGASPTTSRTIPSWDSTFTDPTNGVTYSYTMVGTSPFGALQSTTVPTVVIPFRFVFANGDVLDPTDASNGFSDLQLLQQSPIFTNYTYPTKYSGTGEVTQYGDAIFRAQWNKIGTGYHVLLGQPTVRPTQTISVPANQGFTVRLRVGGLAGLMDYAWFSKQLRNAILRLGVDPESLPMILVDNTFLYQNGDPNDCCVIGYHGASGPLTGQVQTYLFSAMILPGTFGNPNQQGNGVSDIHAFSHEVSEWYDDPFVNNIVNPWLTPTAPQYGCTAFLETGDPVVGYWFALSGNPQNGASGKWHPEDEVHFSWFARESPSRAYGGRYTYIGTFTEPANGC
jgi:hypothetical protein